VVAPNQSVVRVLRADDLWVRAYVPATELGRLRLNQTVQVTVDSHPGRAFDGSVVRIAGESEFTPRNIQSIDERRNQVFGVTIRVADPDGIFKSGMAAQVRIPLEETNE
jgi:HlyD family secretion protein